MEDSIMMIKHFTSEERDHMKLLKLELIQLQKKLMMLHQRRLKIRMLNYQKFKTQKMPTK